MLEEEVRGELMMEREMTMHREAKMGLSIEERLTIRLDSRFSFMHQFKNRWLQDRLAFPGNRSLGLGMEVLPPVLPQSRNRKRAINRNNDEKKCEFKFKEEDILRFGRLILPATTLAVSKTRELFSGEPSKTLKVVPFLLLGAEYGHIITMLRLFDLGMITTILIPIS
ncbi:hypothetical protein Patl1_10828 [Pistacia atlantica]|uniref:Uncharacterized protein n=1 Tax=Pistacia atlantica TaxID=434234 RepID=A0ACC1A7A6_9ROSI|nr:hypothetical protein Patl1_10828 [Pistacia atlantica]